MTTTRRPADATRLAQALHYVDGTTGALIPPIQPSVTFARNQDYELIGNYTYGRYQSPTYDPVERLAAELEGGVEAKIFSSGLAAATTVFETVNTGQHIAVPTIMYHGLQDWLRRISHKRNIQVTLFDATDPAALREAVRPGATVIVWVESLLNPTWDVVDIADVAAVAHEAGAVLAVDATVTPPVTLRALDLGADIVFHSATKYLNGHTDVTAGVLVAKRQTDQWEEIKLVRKLTGGVPGPFEAWLLLRGMRTLALRYKQASASALRIAEHFERHSKVERVLYPGLPSHHGHALSSRQMRGGFGGMLSLLVKGGAEEARRVATAVRVLVPATSLGGVESLIEHRASVEGPHSTVPKNLLRVSVGIEDPDDLIADLEQALAAI